MKHDTVLSDRDAPDIWPASYPAFFLYPAGSQIWLAGYQILKIAGYMAELNNIY
jgi:hypothetical protein